MTDKQLRLQVTVGTEDQAIALILTLLRRFSIYIVQKILRTVCAYYDITTVVVP